MKEEYVVSIFLGVLSSAAFCELVRYFINKLTSNDKLENRFKEIEDKFTAIQKTFTDIDDRLAKQEKDIVRDQLLTLMSDYPNRTDEIMEVAHHYFVDLQGNWYMTDIFTKWIDQEGIRKPTWFKY